MRLINRRGFVAGAAALSTVAIGARRAKAGGGIINPLVRQRADAQVFRHSDGYYYMTGSVPEYDRLVLRRAKTIAGSPPRRNASCGATWRAAPSPASYGRRNCI